MSAPQKWEFPGGKIEPGEAPREALRREVSEELGIEIHVGTLLGTGSGMVDDRTIHLEVYASRWTSGKLELREHSECGWFDADELDRLDWPEADWPILPAVRQHLLETNRDHSSTD